MKTLSAIALSAALVTTAIASTAASAGSITLSAPMAGITLQSRDVDMSLYFIETAGGRYEVVATYVDDTTPNDPGRLVMSLADGDSTSFGLPGHPGVLYGFSRTGSSVTVSDILVSGDGS
ncbi:hypothetical protein [Mesorhizobium sp. A623]